MNTTIHKVLKQYYGYSSFREGQEEIIRAIIDKRDVLAIMPTGSGKSACYQIPAIIFPGITIVISPLIALMKDQVHNLVQTGIKAAYINSSLTPAQVSLAIRRAKEGVYKVIYVAPERLFTEAFMDFAQSAQISLVAVDEAHCISQWGHDFRPSYQTIRNFVNSLNHKPPIAAFTATATVKVREDIASQLMLHNPYCVTTGFDRKNLYFNVIKDSDNFAFVCAYLRKHPESTGIIYCGTRKAVDTLCYELKERGESVSKYHAGLADVERKDSQDDFLYDRCRVMIATNAFGMGIDKSNVSFVIHFNMPTNIESYYQEAGRAGRDGMPAECILLYSGVDVRMGRFLLERGLEENREMDEELVKILRERGEEKLKQMTFYAKTNRCFRHSILTYFGEKSKGYCGNCGNCLSNSVLIDITGYAKTVFSTIKNIDQRYGMGLVIDILLGKKSDRILTLRFDKLNEFGALSNNDISEVREIVNFLVEEEYLMISQGEYPIVKLMNKVNLILVDAKSIMMKSIKHDLSMVKTKKKVSGGEPVDSKLFTDLKLLRKKFADRQGVPAFVVFSDATLKDMCLKLPRNKADLEKISGIGKTKLERYGVEFLEVIAKHGN